MRRKRKAGAGSGWQDDDCELDGEPEGGDQQQAAGTGGDDGDGQDIGAADNEDAQLIDDLLDEILAAEGSGCNGDNEAAVGGEPSQLPEGDPSSDPPDDLEPAGIFGDDGGASDDEPAPPPDRGGFGGPPPPALVESQPPVPEAASGRLAQVILNPAGHRVPAVASVSVPGGRITFYENKRSFEARCSHPSHVNCALTRSSVGSSVSNRLAQGRPLGLMAAWLHSGSQHDSKFSHYACRFIDKAMRNFHRQSLKLNPQAAALLEQERAAREGSGSEPDDNA